MDGKALLYLYDGMVVILRNNFYAQLHQHHAVQLVITLNKPFELLCNSRTAKYTGVIIPADLPHQIQPGEGHHITILLEPETSTARSLGNKFQLNQAPIALPEDNTQRFVDGFRRSLNEPLTHHQAMSLTRQLLTDLSGPLVLAPIDGRVKQAIEILRQHQKADKFNSEIFDAIPLSKSRLAHLFVEQTGIPMRRYLLWVKIQSVVETILSGKTLTESAQMAGFSDLAHLSRTFKNMFGINLSRLFLNHEDIKIIRN